MNEADYGTRDKRGNWTPNAPKSLPPYWTGEWSKMGRFLRDVLWPWNTLHMATALFYIWYIIPDKATLAIFSWDWALWLLFVNMAGIFILYGSIEFLYYVKRRQGTRWRYNYKFPSENPSDVFWFKSQNLDNFLRSFLSGIPIWTAIEVFMLWCYGNGYHVFAWVDWQSNPIWLVVFVLLVPAIHEVHFFCIHRLIHTPFLYKHVHSVHHNSINPSPWSSLSMHPIEHLFYFGEILWHLVLPSHPVAMIFNLHAVGYGALNGHIGFEKLEVTQDTHIDSHAYAHHLHHKYFEVNYGADGIVPLDKWFGLWHDGSKEADEQMKARFRKKRERMNAHRKT